MKKDRPIKIRKTWKINPCTCIKEDKEVSDGCRMSLMIIIRILLALPVLYILLLIALLEALGTFTDNILKNIILLKNWIINKKCK